MKIFFKIILISFLSVFFIIPNNVFASSDCLEKTTTSVDKVPKAILNSSDLKYFSEWQLKEYRESSCGRFVVSFFIPQEYSSLNQVYDISFWGSFRDGMPVFAQEVKSFVDIKNFEKISSIIIEAEKNEIVLEWLEKMKPNNNKIMFYNISYGDNESTKEKIIKQIKLLIVYQIDFTESSLTYDYGGYTLEYKISSGEINKEVSVEHFPKPIYFLIKILKKETGYDCVKRLSQSGFYLKKSLTDGFWEFDHSTLELMHECEAMMNVKIFKSGNYKLSIRYRVLDDILGPDYDDSYDDFKTGSIDLNDFSEVIFDKYSSDKTSWIKGLIILVLACFAIIVLLFFLVRKFMKKLLNK